MRDTSLRFQRRHFEFIAGVMRDAKETGQASNGNTYLTPRGCKEMANAFAAALSSTNPQFNRARFLEACGVDQ